MLAGARVAVVVPAYNEERLIARTLASIPSFVDLVVVVDDGSEDGTAARAGAANDPRVRLRRHPRNRGVGAAIATGYREAFSTGADVAAVMAGDAQMDPDDLAAILGPILRGEADYVKGNRLDHATVRRSMPFLRLVGNRALSALTRTVVGLEIEDSQCGYTALSRTASEALDLDDLWPRYGYPNDLLARAAHARLRVAEVVVRPVYGDEGSGIGIGHALFVIPYVLGRAWIRGRSGAMRRTTLSDAVTTSEA